MTPINLMDRLAAKLQTLMDDYTTEQPSGTLPIKVYPGYFPVRTDASEINSALYVLVKQVMDEEGNKESSAVVEIGFSIYDEDPLHGWRSLFNVLEHVRQYLLKNRIIDKKHWLQLPVETIVFDDQSQAWPQWRATITTKYTISQPEEEGFLYGR